MSLKGAHLGSLNEGERARKMRVANLRSSIVHPPSPCSRGESVKAAWCG
jgi:hypothetical protein